MKTDKLLLGVGLFLIGVMCCSGVAWRIGSTFPQRTVLSIPRRDIVYQTYVTGSLKDRDGKIGFVNRDGSRKEVITVASKGSVVHSPMVEGGMLLFLVDDWPEIIHGGALWIYHQGKAFSCDLRLAWRPSRVGHTKQYVGQHLWLDDGGIGLFRLDQKGCHFDHDLFSPAEMRSLGITAVSGFHTEDKILLVGEHAYVYELHTQQMESLALPPMTQCRLSPDDRQIACVKDEGGSAWIYVFWADGLSLRLKRHWPSKELPSTGVRDLSWSPDGKEIVYHRCVDEQECGVVGDPKNLQTMGIYRLNLDTGEEELVTTGGIMPYWIDWGGVSTETSSP